MFGQFLMARTIAGLGFRPDRPTISPTKFDALPNVLGKANKKGHFLLGKKKIVKKIL